MVTRSLAKLMLLSPTGQLTVRYHPYPDGSNKSHHPSVNSRKAQLQFLPQELFVEILKMLSLNDIGNLSLCGSVDIRDKIVSWIQSKSFALYVESRHLMWSCGMDEEIVVDKWIDVSNSLGFLFKRASMVFTTSSRLRLLSQWFVRVEQIVVDTCQVKFYFLSLLFPPFRFVYMM